jgi:hypothetical protein
MMCAVKKLLSVAAVLIISGGIAATASASLRTYIVGTKYVKGVGTVGSFKRSVNNPYKIILFCEGVNARCGANVVCLRGTDSFTWVRSGLAPGTWNLKKKTWRHLDRCHFKATIKSGGRDARVTVQATVRS